MPIPARKIILIFVLVCSILLFFFILFVGGVAVLREASPQRHSGIVRLILAVKHYVAHRILHHK